MTWTAPTSPIKLILCDIDGCLSPESSDPMDIAALTKVAHHNTHAAARLDRPLLTLCSGRPQPFVEGMCKLLNNMHAPAIAENGVWLYDPSNNDYIRDPAITRDHRDIVRTAARWVDDRFGHQGLTQQPGKTDSISLYHPDTDLLHNTIEPAVREKFQDEGWPFRVSHTWFYINCDLDFVSKATGIDRLLTKLSLTKHDCLGIGDTTSDLAIRQRVGTFACPANAQDELKAHADYVSSGAQVGGVLDILERYATPTSMHSR